MTYISTDDFRHLVRTKSYKSERVRKSYSADIADAGDRSLRFIISTADKDRSGDIIDQQGWQLDNYKRNPVVLLFHDRERLPVARTTSIEVEDTKLIATIEFVPSNIPIAGEIADTVFQMCQQGFLNAASVGFIPLAYDYDDENDTILFQVSELCEFSIVPVPDNPSALITQPLLIEPSNQTASINNSRVRRRMISRLLRLKYS
jgi:HK97 family phage prohead protease